MTTAPAQGGARGRIPRLAARLGGLAFAAGAIILLAGAFARSGPTILAAAVLIGVGAGANAAAWIARTLALWRTGVWTTLGGGHRSREAQPGRFVGVLAVHALASAAWVLGAGALLAWIVMAHVTAVPAPPASSPVQSAGAATSR